MEPDLDLVVLGGGIVGIWVAAAVAERGGKVALVEAGPLGLDAEPPPTPPIRFAERENLGATRARHRVLTGNSAYWGGGLCRNDLGSVREMFGFADEADAARRITSHYESIERSLGIRPPAGDAPSSIFERTSIEEIAVLPGKRRGLWSRFAQKAKNGTSSVVCLTNAKVQEVLVDGQGRVTGLVVESVGQSKLLTARVAILAMGVIDSCIFARQMLAKVTPSGAARYVGTRLHDHWSIPVARVRWRNGTAVSALFPPKFQRGGIIGRRSVIDGGFLHFTADLGSTPPYDRVKAFLASRQKSEPLARQLRTAISTLERPFLMAGAGVHYLAQKELLIPDGSEVSLTLDFESVASPENRITLNGETAVLSWDVRPEDVSYFKAFVSERRESICRTLGSHGLDLAWLAGQGGTDETEDYLRRAAIDAYHLGGGLQSAGDGTDGVVDTKWTVRGTQNLFALGTATFRRPGLANPVLTLLAQARQFVLDQFPSGDTHERSVV